jgi:hypothetical protein
MEASDHRPHCVTTGACGPRAQLGDLRQETTARRMA